MSSYENNIENIDKHDIRTLDSDINSSNIQSKITSIVNSKNFCSNTNSNNEYLNEKNKAIKNKNCFNSINRINNYYGNYNLRKKIHISYKMFVNKLLYYCSFIINIIIEKRFIKISDKYIRRYLKVFII